MGFSPSECSAAASVPLPPLRRSRVAEAGLVAVLLEEWLLKPLQSLASVRPAAELYRLKRKIMDRPFLRKKHWNLTAAAAATFPFGFCFHLGQTKLCWWRISLWSRSTAVFTSCRRPARWFWPTMLVPGPPSHSCSIRTRAPSSCCA